MTTEDRVTTLETLATSLEELSDLFKRRLLDDRTKQAAIEDLQGRLTRAERALSATSVGPVVEGLCLLAERIETVDPSDQYNVVNEVRYVLESLLLVTPVAAVPGDPVDRSRHEVVAASGDGPELRVERVVRTGYEKDGVVLRPAKVVAVRSRPGDGSQHTSDEDG